MKNLTSTLRLALLAATAPIAILSLYGCPDNTEPTDVSRAFVYVTNNGENTVTAFSADATGALTKVQTFATGQAPLGAAMVSTFNPNGQPRDFVYVANSGDNTVSQYEQFADGSLVPLNPPTVPAGQFPVALDGEVNGNLTFLRVANKGDNTVTEYTFQSDGKLVFNHTIATGNSPVALTHTPSAQANTMWVLNSGDNTISEYNPGPANGPTPISPTGSYPAGAGSTGLLYVENGAEKHLLVTNEGDNTILAYPVSIENPQQSAVSDISGSATTTAAQGRPQAIAGFHAGNVQPAGFFLFTASADGFVGRYTLPDGTTTVQAMNPPSVAAGAHPISVAVDHHGNDYVYVANQGDGTVSSYFSAANHSSLTPIGGAIRSGDRSSFVLLTRTPQDRKLANPPSSGGIIVPVK